MIINTLLFSFLTLQLVVINAAGGPRIVSECEAHSEADNDVVEDVELIADEECARNVSSSYNF